MDARAERFAQLITAQTQLLEEYRRCADALAAARVALEQNKTELFNLFNESPTVAAAAPATARPAPPVPRTTSVVSQQLSLYPATSQPFGPSTRWKTGTAFRIFEALWSARKPLSLETLRTRLKVPSGTVSSAMHDLKVKGVVYSVGGGRWDLTAEYEKTLWGARYLTFKQKKEEGRAAIPPRTLGPGRHRGDKLWHIKLLETMFKLPDAEWTTKALQAALPDIPGNTLHSTLSKLRMLGAIEYPQGPGQGRYCVRREPHTQRAADETRQLLEKFKAGQPLNQFLAVVGGNVR